MGERRQREDDPEIQKQVMVECGTVCAGICGQQGQQGREVES
jgi:hypothetical protein